MRTLSVTDTNTMLLTLDEVIAGHSAVSFAYAKSQRIELLGQVRLGSDPLVDKAVLRFLGEATAQLVEVDWTLRDAPPWPARTLVHLIPPSDCENRDFLRWWKENHRFGLCTYRCGPDFVRILDIRPGGQRLRAVADGRWAQHFAGLVEDTDPPRGDCAQLFTDLEAAGLALRLGDRHHVLPFRLRRWPVPHPDQ